MERNEIQISDGNGPNGWAAALLAGGIAAAGVVLAVAVWQISMGLSVFFIATGVGVGLGRFLYGLAAFSREHQKGIAMRIDAEGRARSMILEAEARKALAWREVRRPTQEERWNHDN